MVILSKNKAKESEKRNAEKTRKALMNILDDVEEARKKAVEERDKTLAIVTNFVDGLMVVNKQGIVTMINPEFEKMFGVKKSKVKGEKLRRLKSVRLFAPAIDLLLDKEGIISIERKEFTSQEEVIIEVTTVSLKEKKEEGGHLIIFHDISREKIVEKLKSEFVSISAHQLRTPLSAIKWTLRMMLDGDIGKISKEQKGFLEKTYRTNERMILLTNDLLDITRIEEGRYLCEPTLVDIKELIGQIIKIFKDEIKEKRIKLEFKKSEKDLPKVKIDVEKMKLVIQNLIENAVRYNPQGGKITISLKSNNKEIEFLIKNSGCGIPKAQQKRVFSKFFRASNAAKIDTEGTGLGLFISKNIIEAHEGKIWFKSEENKETCFYFTIPIFKR